ncbi:MAG: Crp/Fnr family transcriptional regulator [Bacteroidota bacterium]
MSLIQQLTNGLEEAGLWEKEITLGRNEYLKVKGSTDTRLFYILSGSLRIYFEDDLEEQILRLGYTGDIITALDSFLTDQPSELYIQIIRKCRLKVTSKAAFLQYINSDPAHLNIWLELQSQFIYQQMEREKDVLIYSPRKRYQRVLARSPKLFQEIPNKYIASYLRMSPETLSRLKKS